MGIKKSIKKLFREPTEMRLEEIVSILIFMGYKLDRVKGSHHVFTKKAVDDIIIPSHNKKVRRIYLKEIKKIFISSQWFMIKTLTVKIRNISEGKEIGYCATIKELGNSIVMADSIEEIFDLMPDLIASAKKNDIGIYKKKKISRTRKTKGLIPV